MRALLGLSAMLLSAGAAAAESAEIPLPMPTPAPAAAPVTAGNATAADDPTETDLADTDDIIVTDEVVVIESEAPLGPGTATERLVGADTIAVTAKHSADDILRLVPGLHLSRHGSEGKAPQIFLRGFDAVHGSDLAVGVAGIPINEMSNVHGHGYVDLGFVIPEVVRSLHGRKGSFGLDQGNFATAGSVDFELGVPSHQRGTRLGYELGATNRHRMLAVFAPASNDEASFAAVEAVSDHGFGQNRTAERMSALGQHRIEFAPGHVVELIGGAYAARFDEPGTVPVEAVEGDRVGFYDTMLDGGQGSSYRALAGVRVHGQEPGQRWDARAHVGWRELALNENFTGFLLYPDRGDRRAQTHQALSAGATGTYQRTLAAGLSLHLGTGLQAENIHQSEHQVGIDGMRWHENRNLRGNQLTGHAYAGTRLRVGSFLAEAGARADAVALAADDHRAASPLGSRGQDSMAALSPRLRASLALAPGWTLFGAYGRGLRSPELQSVLPPLASEDLAMPEVDPPAMNPSSSRTAESAPGITTSDALELGLRAHLSPALEIGAGGFATWIDREVMFDHLSGSSLFLQATRRLGFELDASYRPLPWLTLRADLAATSGRFVASDNPIPGVPPLLLGLAASAHHNSGWYGGAQFRYLAPRPLANGATGSASDVLDLTGGVRVGQFALALQIDNALNRRWREGEYHYASWFDKQQPRSQLPRLHYTAGKPLGVRASLAYWF